MADDWNQHEIAVIVADYFDMLGSELRGERYNKAQHNRQLQKLLPARSKGSIEFKNCNISAALIHFGLPYIKGYQPRWNYQRRLSEAVAERLSSQPAFYNLVADAAGKAPDHVPVHHGPTDSVFDEPPDHMITPEAPTKPWLSRRGRWVNFLEREARNRQLGQVGEQFVVDLERWRLKERGRDDLAARVEWVASTCGDGLGFDVLSFDDRTDEEQLIEVKTTTQGKHFPFYVTGNEVRCSEDMEDQFRLYRVFEFSAIPRVYIVPGSLTKELELEPTEYRARIAR